VAAASAVRAGHPQHFLCLLGKAPDGLQQQARESVGELDGLTAVAAQQFLSEQRVAFGSPVERVGPFRGQLAALDRGGELGGLTAAEPGQVDPLDPADPGQLRQQGSQRVGTVQFIGPERGDDQRVAQRPLIPGQEREQVPARAVRPVHVLDDDHQRRGIGQSFQQGEEFLE
jgi:hypothetical protein